MTLVITMFLTLHSNTCSVYLQAIYNMLGSAVTENNPEDTPEKRTVEIFEKMDINKDGVLSKDEFIKGCMNDQFLYQMLTADQSGGMEG